MRTPSFSASSKISSKIKWNYKLKYIIFLFAETYSWAGDPSSQEVHDHTSKKNQIDEIFQQNHTKKDDSLLKAWTIIFLNVQ